MVCLSILHETADGERRVALTPDADPAGDPSLALRAAEASARDVQLLTIAYDENDLGNLKTFMTAQRSTWPSINAPGATITWGLSGVPESFLVDPDGFVLAHIVGQVYADQLDVLLSQARAGEGR